MNVKNLKLSELVTKPVTVSPSTSLMKTRETILKQKVKRVIIIDKKIPIGVITEKDLAKKFMIYLQLQLNLSKQKISSQGNYSP